MYMIFSCTCLDYTEDMMYRRETELTAGLGVAIGLMGIEMVSLVTLHFEVNKVLKSMTVMQ